MALSIEEAKALSLLTEAYRILSERLKPAKLADTQGNGMRLVAWAKEVNGGNAPETASAFADALERAVRQHLHDGQLEWEKEPRALSATKTLTGRQKLQSTAEAHEEFLAKKAHADKVEAQKKADEASQKQVGLAIDGLQFVTCGRIMHGKTEVEKEKLRAVVDQCRKRGDSWQDIAAKVETKIQALYEEVEKAAERV